MIIGCNENGDFCSDCKGENDDQDEPGNCGVRWTYVEDILSFTKENHCYVCVAYSDE
jgi:hypothetical protein